MRKPARQQPLDKTEELPIGTDPDRSLANRERNQLRITNKRPPTAASRDPILISEDIGCNNKGFQIRHLELLSRGDTCSGSPSSSSRGSLRNPADFHIKPLARSAPGPTRPPGAQSARRLTGDPASRRAERFAERGVCVFQ